MSAHTLTLTHTHTHIVRAIAHEGLKNINLFACACLISERSTTQRIKVATTLPIGHLGADLSKVHCLPYEWWTGSSFFLCLNRNVGSPVRRSLCRPQSELPFGGLIGRRNQISFTGRWVVVDKLIWCSHSPPKYQSFRSDKNVVIVMRPNRSVARPFWDKSGTDTFLPATYRGLP